MAVAPHRITVRLVSGQNFDAVMRTYVNLAEETGLNKTAIFFGEDSRTDFVAGKRMGEWVEIAKIAGRPAIDVAREVSAPYKSPEDVIQRFRGHVLFDATKRLITYLEAMRRDRRYHVHLYCLPNGTYDLARQNADHSIMEPFAVAEYSCGCWAAGPTIGFPMEMAEIGAEDVPASASPALGM